LTSDLKTFSAMVTHTTITSV